MTAARILPYTIIAISAAAAVVYGLSGDWRRAMYWTGAVIVGLAVTL